MKRTLELSLIGLGLLAGGSSLLRQRCSPEHEIDQLRAELSELRATLGKDIKALKQDARQVDAAVYDLTAYLKGQALHAAGLLDIIADSEKKGFTSGINPESRTVLVQGWKAYYGWLAKLAVQSSPASTKPLRAPDK